MTDFFSPSDATIAAYLALPLAARQALAEQAEGPGWVTNGEPVGTGVPGSLPRCAQPRFSRRSPMSRAVFNHRIFTLDQEITKLLTELLVYAESAQNMTPEYAEKGHGLITRIMVCRQERAALDALKHYLPPEVADEF